MVNDLYPIGKLLKDSEGKVVCYICKRSFHNLGNHVRNSHHLTPSEYRFKFGLNNGCPLCSEELSNKRKNIVNDYPELIEQLIKHGEPTRMKKGKPTYTADKVREQASISKRDRLYSPQTNKKLMELGRKLGKSKKGTQARWGKN